MREIDIDELKAIQLDMLKDIHSFCVSHDIKYSLAFGSLLGAIRHKGYIPWDADIDIMMRRDDYERFVTTYGSEMYRIVDLQVSTYYCQPYAKVENVLTIVNEYSEEISEYGVSIDIFPVDNIPNGSLRQKCFYSIKSFLNVIHNLKMVKISQKRPIYKNIILYISHFILYPLSGHYIAMIMSNYASQYSSVNTDYSGIVVPADSRLAEAIPSYCFDKYIELEFEKNKFMAIEYYDCYLKAAYGNYMQLPPVEQRVSHHENEAWWK